MILLVMTDGRRSCISRSIPSALEMLSPVPMTRLIWNDSEDPDYASWLQQQFVPLGFQIGGDLRRRGFGGAIQAAWMNLRTIADTSSIVHAEDDFIFTRPIPLDRMQAQLDAHPYLLQMALRRQPVNDNEIAAGGIVEQQPDSYTECRDGEDAWLEHRVCFTTNPSLYRWKMCLQSWPSGSNSEGNFTHHLLRAGVDGMGGEVIRFGFWGARDSGEWCQHIGIRSGIGY